MTGALPEEKQDPGDNGANGHSGLDAFFTEHDTAWYAAPLTVWSVSWSLRALERGSMQDGTDGKIRSQGLLCVCAYAAVPLMPPLPHSARSSLVTGATCLTRCSSPYVARYDDAAGVGCEPHLIGTTRTSRIPACEPTPTGPSVR